MDMVSVRHGAEKVECFRCAGEECPKCGGTGYRERRVCASCGEPARVLSPKRTARSVEEAKALPLYCPTCNPRLAGVGVTLAALATTVAGG